MCELVNARFVSAQDINGEYQKVVYLNCCQCGQGNTPIRIQSPLCDNCLGRLHYQEITDDITKCGRCDLFLRGVMPLPMCVACQSITNYNGYNDKLVGCFNG